MNEAMITNHNRVVTKNDIVIFLGDFAFHTSDEAVLKIYRSLNGNKIWLRGNHDRTVPGITQSTHEILELTGKQWVPFNPVLCHYPMLSWNRSFHGSFQLHGHVHGKVPHDGMARRWDVGVDANSFTPVSWDHIREELSKTPIPKERMELKELNGNQGTA